MGVTMWALLVTPGGGGTLGSLVLTPLHCAAGCAVVTIMLVEAEPSSSRQIIKDLTKIPGMQVSVQNTQPWMASGEQARCTDGISYMGMLRATGVDKPGILTKLAALLTDAKLDVHTLSCNQHWQTALKEGHEETEKLFQITGVVRAFDPIDREELERKLVAFERAEGVRVGISETEVDTSYSAFRSSNVQVSRNPLRRTKTNM